MKHCHISILCNELPFLKEKVPFLYKHFKQLIFVDYDLVNKKNSVDGSIEFIETYPDPENKIILIKNFDPSKIKYYHGGSFVEKQKMFSAASKFVHDNIDVVWATDLDEFFETELIKEVEELYKKDPALTSIDLPHRIFVYNQYNYYNKPDFYIVPRITRHKKKFIYGHCDFHSYGKTIKYTYRVLYHFAFVGFNRCSFKFEKIYKNSSFNHKKWLQTYLSAYKNKQKYVKLSHSNTHFGLISQPYNGKYPDYLDVEKMCNELNICNNEYLNIID